LAAGECDEVEHPAPKVAQIATTVTTARRIRRTSNQTTLPAFWFPAEEWHTMSRNPRARQ
jgi:hypothetical protein